MWITRRYHYYYTNMLVGSTTGYRWRCYSVCARDMGSRDAPYDSGLARAAKATWRPFRLCQIDRAVGALAGKVGCEAGKGNSFFG